MFPETPGCTAWGSEGLAGPDYFHSGAKNLPEMNYLPEVFLPGSRQLWQRRASLRKFATLDSLLDISESAMVIWRPV